jgi:hypothetical protein
MYVQQLKDKLIHIELHYLFPVEYSAIQSLGKSYVNHDEFQFDLIDWILQFAKEEQEILGELIQELKVYDDVLCVWVQYWI